MVDYPEREQATCAMCGGHQDDCVCQFAWDDLLEDAPPCAAWCEGCQMTTPHADLCDEHGSNRLFACLTCRRVAHFY